MIPTLYFLSFRFLSRCMGEREGLSTGNGRIRRLLRFCRECFGFGAKRAHVASTCVTGPTKLKEEQNYPTFLDKPGTQQPTTMTMPPSGMVFEKAKYVLMDGTRRMVTGNETTGERDAESLLCRWSKGLKRRLGDKPTALILCGPYKSRREP